MHKRTLSSSQLTGLAAVLAILTSVPSQSSDTKEAAPAVHAVQIDFFFESVPPADSVILIASHSADDEIETSVSTPVTGEGIYELELRADKSWKVRCRSDHFWCPTLDVGPSESSSYMPVFRSVDLSGKVTSQQRAGLPETLVVQGWLSIEGLSESLVSFIEEVPVAEDGRFELRGPEGSLDLRMSSKGWAPYYLWGIKGKGSTDLKQIPMKTGSSISGFAWDDVEDLPAAKAEVAAIPAGLNPEYSGDRKLERLANKTLANERGFFQIDGLSPGVYRLEVSSPGRSPQIIERITVLAESETLLDGRINLIKPFQLEVYLDPPIPFPDEHWTVRLLATARSVPDQSEIIVQADSTGIVRIEGLIPQNYFVQIQDPKGSKIFQEDKYIDRDSFLEIELPVVAVKGTLRLNGDPLGASLSIQAGFKDKSEFVSDSETGEFSGIIRKPDMKILIIDVRSKAPDFRRRIYVKNPDVREGKLDLDLDLVGVDVSGHVVDSKGQSVEGAKVSARYGLRVVTTTTARDGNFTLIALDEGRYDLQAKSSTGNSEVLPIDLVADSIPPSFRLVLHEKNAIRAVLRSHDGEPVPQAQITVFSAGPVPTSSSGESDIEGRFEFTVTPDTSHVLLQVRAASHVLWSACLEVDTRSEAPMIVNLPPVPGGYLEVRTEDAPTLDGPPQTSSRWVLVTSDRGFLDFNEVYNWHLLTGQDSARSPTPDHWWIPGLAAGRQYAAIRSAEPRWKIASDLCLGGPPPDAEWHYLPEGGSTTILVDTEAKPR